MSPLEHVFRPDLVPPDAEARAEHDEIARTLAESGADLLLIEAMATVRELRCALGAARATGLPIWVSLAVDDRGRLLGGDALAQAQTAAADQGAAALIVTAAPTVDVRLALTGLGEADGMLLGAAPMCGRFDPPSWKFEFHPRFGELPAPSAFADELAGLASARVRVVGAWCGATPEHVGALRARIGGG
jgi:methionine synthase I (cobalamin-dependent)